MTGLAFASRNSSGGAITALSHTDTLFLLQSLQREAPVTCTLATTSTPDCRKKDVREDMKEKHNYSNVGIFVEYYILLLHIFLSFF